MGAHGYFQGRFAVCWFGSTHALSFPVLLFHFLYRLLAVKGSPEIRLFSMPSYYIFLFSFVAFISVSWFCVLYYLYDADEFVEQYMAPILRDHAQRTNFDVDDYITAVFWTNGTFCGPRWKPIFGLLIMTTTMSGCYGFMMYAAYTIAWHMRRNSRSQSDRTVRMQKQLMTALAYQAILPLITAYFAPLTSTLGPFLGLAPPLIDDVSPFLCGMHPWLDGCVLLWTIKAYRVMVLQWIRRAIPGQKVGRTTIVVRGSSNTTN